MCVTPSTYIHVLNIHIHQQEKLLMNGLVDGWID